MFSNKLPVAIKRFTTDFRTFTYYSSIKKTVQCCSQSVFLDGIKVYKQIDGVRVSSTSVPILANRCAV